MKKKEDLLKKHGVVNEDTIYTSFIMMKEVDSFIFVSDVYLNIKLQFPTSETCVVYKEERKKKRTIK